MELIDQHAKQIMEGCKARARDAGLRFDDESLEYYVTNRDLLELSPKGMIPTLYDYWVHDVEVLRERGRYELYPTNPYETVINTRPAISFYNDNNPDWLNVMIFYHVLAHIDFFQNNTYFRHTWNYDFTGQALSDKRLIAKLRSEHGRWVDYVIEFSRSIDNLVGYFRELSRLSPKSEDDRSERLDYFFDVFLQDVKKVKPSDYLKEIQHYNACRADAGPRGEDIFFADVIKQYPEFEGVFLKYKSGKQQPKPLDLLQFLLRQSAFLNRDENRWMKSVIHVVRNTSLFFQPQIRTKIMNEGWASYWHETLFLRDDRIRGHEVDFARVNAGVTTMPRVGLNPYALGMRLFYYIEDLADRGRRSWDFQRLRDAHRRHDFDRKSSSGRDYIFQIRENFSDFNFIQTFVDQDFVNLNKLFVAGRRLNPARMVWEYFVQSRRVEDYRKMLMEHLYHPPSITLDPARTTEDLLYLVHHFEGKPLVREYLKNTMMGIEYLWDGSVQLETSEIKGAPAQARPGNTRTAKAAEAEMEWERVLYTMKKRELTREIIDGK
ncbi:MAG: SpoVR family protein [Acidobacteria bacterium]|nr:SpoVR family protein [Acidobacteriota bacterium]